MTDDKIKFTQGALEALRVRIKEQKEAGNHTWKVLAGMMGVGESTLEAFSRGTYRGDNQALAEEIAKWFRTEEEQELFGHHLLVPGFVPTTTAKYVQGILTFAKLGNMATIMGEPGVGKTMAIADFSRHHSHVFVVTASPLFATPNAFMGKVLEAMNMSLGGRSGWHLSDRIRKVLRARKDPLLCIDEAQHLGEKMLEELRSIHDDTGCGIVFIGNREVTRTVDGTRTANFAQRASRIGKRADLTGPMGHDVKLLLEAWDVVDAREAQFLTDIAMRPGGGALRQMSKVLEQATIVANAEKVKRSLAHLKDAADDLTAGIAA